MSNTPIQIDLNPRRIKGINRIGFLSLVEKEIGRFMNVYMQTLIAPVVTMVLFFAVFTLSFKQHIATGMGVSGMQFLAPGLLMMTMTQNAFANTSSSLIIAKVQGNIVDILMPPLSSLELLAGMLTGSLVRSVLIGSIGYATMSIFVSLPVSSVSVAILFSFLGNLMLAVMGVMAGIWADRFDHMATVTNFIITPLTFLSGTFYTLGSLPEFWQKIALFNPFFYMIDGFRAGFTGYAETGLTTGAIILAVLDALLLAAAWWMIESGYKTKS